MTDNIARGALDIHVEDAVVPAIKIDVDGIAGGKTGILGTHVAAIFVADSVAFEAAYHPIRMAAIHSDVEHGFNPADGCCFKISVGYELLALLLLLVHTPQKAEADAAEHKKLNTWHAHGDGQRHAVGCFSQHAHKDQQDKQIHDRYARKDEAQNGVRMFLHNGL